MIPQVDTPDEVRQAIHDAKYPPIGERGIAPFFAGYLDGVSARDVVDNANDETLLILQMESVEAWEQIDEILAIPDFEVILAGLQIYLHLWDSQEMMQQILRLRM